MSEKSQLFKIDMNDTMTYTKYGMCLIRHTLVTSKQRHHLREHIHDDGAFIGQHNATTVRQTEVRMRARKNELRLGTMCQSARVWFDTP